MGKIRRNALNYSVRDYKEILLENLDTISDTKEKFQKYRELVRSRVKKLEEENINVRRLGEKEEENLDGEIEKMIEERQAARKARDFKRADEIRDELLAQGIILEDTREGVKWKRA